MLCENFYWRISMMTWHILHLKRFFHWNPCTYIVIHILFQTVYMTMEAGTGHSVYKLEESGKPWSRSLITTGHYPLLSTYPQQCVCTNMIPTSQTNEEIPKYCTLQHWSLMEMFCSGVAYLRSPDNTHSSPWKVLHSKAREGTCTYMHIRSWLWYEAKTLLSR